MKLINARIEETHPFKTSKPTSSMSESAMNIDYEEKIHTNKIIRELKQSICSECETHGSNSGSQCCALCGRAVHAMDTCSVAYDEEGCSQQRICLLCWQNKDFRPNIALCSFENWKNKGEINRKNEQENRTIGRKKQKKNIVSWRKEKYA